MLTNIRAWRDHHPELLRAHNFVFGLPFDDEHEDFEYMLIGRTPGETKQNAAVPGPTEETIEENWMLRNGTEARTGSSRRWRKAVKEHLPNGGIMQTELFFWSVPTTGADFRERFGTTFQKSPHLTYCRDMNLALLRLIRPRVIVFVGVTDAEKTAYLYGLTPVESHKGEDGSYLCRRYFGHERQWIFTKHWTAGHGYSKMQKAFVKAEIEKARCLDA